MGSVLVHPQLAVGRGRGLRSLTGGKPERHGGSLTSVALNVFGIFMDLKSDALEVLVTIVLFTHTRWWHI